MNRVMGVDLGQANDYTALTVLQPAANQDGGRIDDDVTGIIWDVPMIERIPLHTRYPNQVRIIAEAAKKLIAPIEVKKITEGESERGWKVYKQAKAEPIVPKLAMIVDYTGVGRPVLDMFWEAQANGLIPEAVDIIACTITGGSRATYDDAGVHVPKKDLAGTVQAVMQEERLRIARAHPKASLMTEELKGFRVKINANGHMSFGAGEDWRSAEHDDLVLCLALGLWYAETTAER